jgi:hypothetical protein
MDGTFAAVWEHVRRIYWLPWVLGILFILAGASTPQGVLCSLVTATLFVALIIWHGIACSLTARTTTGALVATLALPLVTLAGTALLIGFLEEDHGPLLWILSVGSISGCWLWIRRVLSLASVTCFLIAVHLACAVFMSAWTYDGRKDEYPVAAMHPGFLTLVMLSKNIHRDFEGVSPVPILACYWAAVAASLFLTRAWVIRHFDRLAGRSSQPAGEPYEPRYGNLGLGDDRLREAIEPRAVQLAQATRPSDRAFRK